MSKRTRVNGHQKHCNGEVAPRVRYEQERGGRYRGELSCGCGARVAARGTAHQRFRQAQLEARRMAGREE